MFLLVFLFLKYPVPTNLGSFNLCNSQSQQALSSKVTKWNVTQCICEDFGMQSFHEIWEPLEKKENLIKK